MTNTTYQPTSGKSRVSNSAAKTQASLRQLSILIADDTPAYQKFVKQVLEDRGHVVIHVNDGNEATKCYSQHRFDVIVADVQMPNMNGFELARWIREQEKNGHRRTPIIALTAHDNSAARGEGFAAGIDTFLTKPIDTGMLVEVVETLASQQKGPRMKTSRSKGPAGLAGGDEDKNGKMDVGPIVDFDGAMARLGGDRELFREFIGVYDEDMPTLMQALRTALEGLDGQNVERNAHSLKGLISNFGARRAVETAVLMEEIAKGKRWPEAPALFEKLEHEIKRLSEALEEYR